jgi:hypothetical protein
MEEDRQVLVVVTQEVPVEIVDLAMWSSRLMDWLMDSSYKVPADAH